MSNQNTTLDQTPRNRPSPLTLAMVGSVLLAAAVWTVALVEISTVPPQSTELQPWSAREYRSSANPNISAISSHGQEDARTDWDGRSERQLFLKT